MAKVKVSQEQTYPGGNVKSAIVLGFAAKRISKRVGFHLEDYQRTWLRALIEAFGEDQVGKNLDGTAANL